MPIKATQQFTAWSYSRYNDYTKCPAYAKYSHLDKLPQPGSIYLERGSLVHKSAENFATNKVKKLPEELKLFIDEFKDLRKRKLEIESQWAVDKNWKKADWFAKNTWCRMVVDAAHTIDKTSFKVIDYKTGKVREENKKQLGLYALGAFSRYPHLQTVVTSLWYLDQGIEVEENFKSSQVPELKKFWIKETKAMLNDTTFAPRPNDSCRYCHYRKDNGGRCKF